jgi:hypothetical protein
MSIADNINYPKGKYQVFKMVTNNYTFSSTFLFIFKNNILHFPSSSPLLFTLLPVKNHKSFKLNSTILKAPTKINHILNNNNENINKINNYDLNKTEFNDLNDFELIDNIIIYK